MVDTFCHNSLFSYAIILTLICHVGNPTDCPTRYFFLVGTSLFSCQHMKQTIVSRFRIEGEYHALADTTLKLPWLQWLLQNMGVSLSSRVYYDYKSAI